MAEENRLLTAEEWEQIRSDFNSAVRWLEDHSLSVAAPEEEQAEMRALVQAAFDAAPSSLFRDNLGMALYAMRGNGWTPYDVSEHLRNAASQGSAIDPNNPVNWAGPGLNRELTWAEKKALREALIAIHTAVGQGDVLDTLEGRESVRQDLLALADASPHQGGLSGSFRNYILGALKGMREDDVRPSLVLQELSIGSADAWQALPMTAEGKSDELEELRVQALAAASALLYDPSGHLIKTPTGEQVESARRALGKIYFRSEPGSELREEMPALGDNLSDAQFEQVMLRLREMEGRMLEMNAPGAEVQRARELAAAQAAADQRVYRGMTGEQMARYHDGEFHGYARVDEDQGSAKPLDTYVFSGTAEAGDKVDPYAPWLEDRDDAYQNAKMGITFPYSLQVGTPRVYRFNLEGMSAEDRTPLVVTPTEEWIADFQEEMVHWSSHTDDTGLGEEDRGDIEAKFAAEAGGEDLWRKLIADAREVANQRGKAFFVIEGGLEKDSFNRDAYVHDMVFPANPQRHKPTSSEIAGYLPGMKYPPGEEDLILYHGGQRGQGMVGLAYRQTADGEALEPLPVLGETEAIWAKDAKDLVTGYARSENSHCEYYYGEEGCEPHIYTIDAANAQVAEITTGHLSQRQADAVVMELLSRRGVKRPDVLRLLRRSGGEEYFIPEGPYKVTLARAEVLGDPDYWGHPGAPVELPPVQTAPGVPFAPPSEDMCLRMSVNGPYNDQVEGEDNEAYWETRCEQGDFRPDMANMAKFFEEEADNADEEEGDNLAVMAARQDYWKSYVVNKGPDLNRTLNLLKAAPEKPPPSLTRRAKAPFSENYKPPRPGRPSKHKRSRRANTRPIAKIH